MRRCATASRLQELHAEIDALDAKISGRLQLELYAIVQDVLVDRLGWFARNLEPGAGLESIVAHYRAASPNSPPSCRSPLARTRAKAVRETEARLKAGHVPELLARAACAAAGARARRPTWC